MSRLEAVAAGLYYPTPEPVAEAIAHMLRIEAVTIHDASTVRILDPCVGTGRALALLAEHLCTQATPPARLIRPGEAEVATSAQYPLSHHDPVRLELYGVELNRTRAQGAAAQCSGGVLVASFSTTTIAEASFSLAFVNPPYDDDYASSGTGSSGGTGSTGRRVRLEIQFLKRVTHKLLPEGILVWIVPQARLAEAAAYLAGSYGRLACWRFPDEPWKAPDAPTSAELLPMYAAFQQVVLLGRRRFTLVPPDPDLIAQIEDWTRQGATLPILPGAGRDRAPPAGANGAAGAWSEPAPYLIPFAHGQAPTFEAWAYDPDATARQVSLPGSGIWHQPTYCEQRWPHLDTTDLGIGRPPMPLREGHLSLLVASGVANGLVVVGKRGWRALVKGGSIKERVRTTEVDDDGTHRDIETERFVNEVYLTALQTGELIHVVSGMASEQSAPGHQLDHHNSSETDALEAGAGSNGVCRSSVSGPVAGAAAMQAATSAATSVAPLVFTQQTMTMAEFLGEFGPSLMTQVAEAAPPLYLGPEDAPFAPLTLLKRRPIGAQGLIAQAKACAIRGLRGVGSEPGWKRVPRLGNVGEMSTGKTYLALATLALADEEVSGVATPAGQRPEKRAFFPAIVICPPIMVEKWAREARLTLPDPVKTVIIRTLETRQEAETFRQFDPTFHGKHLSAVGVAQRVAQRIQADLAAWRAARDAAVTAGRTPPRKPCHLVVLSHSTAKLGSAWSPRYVLRALRAPDTEGRLRLVRQASGAPYVVLCCPSCSAPLCSDMGTQKGRTPPPRAGLSGVSVSEDAQAIYLTEEQVSGEAGPRVKRRCAACGEALWQVVPEVGAPRVAWRALPPPVASVDESGRLLLARRAVPALPLPSRGSHRPASTRPAGLTGLANQANRRYPIADYLRKHHRGLFRSVVADEAHEFSGGETAQALALGSLVEACNPGGTLLWLTGTLFSGYASELFQMQRIVNDHILEQFGWHGHRRWMERYGVERHIILTPPDDRAIGAVSKRKEGREVTQELPGISPLMLRHILPCCVFVELADIARDLPPLIEEVRTVPLGPVLGPIYSAFEREATSALHAELAGGDRGALSSWYHGLLIQPNLPSRAITVRNARSGTILAETEALPGDTIWPKEAELLRIVREERARGRRVLIFVEHTGEYDLLARLSRLIEADDARWRAGLPPSDPLAPDDSVDLADQDRIPTGARAIPVGTGGQRDQCGEALEATAADRSDHASASPATTPSAPELITPRPPLPSVRVTVLRSNTCPPARREAWLARAVERGCDVLLTHSACVQVGLDLEGFPTIVCFETIPSTNRARQATRRSYRLGQKLPVRIIQLAYDESAEARLLLLVARKMRSSLMAEGKLPGEGLATYGEDEGDLMLQLARAVLDDVRHGAHRGMAGSLEAVLQEVRALDQRASRFIAGERLEAALAADTVPVETILAHPGGLAGSWDGTGALPCQETCSGVPSLGGAEGTPPHSSLFPMERLAAAPSAFGSPAVGSGSVRVTTPSTAQVGRGWEELARELQRLKQGRRSGSHGRGTANGKANGHASQDAEASTCSLWSEHAGIATVSLWGPATPDAPAPQPSGRELGSASGGDAANEAAPPSPGSLVAESLWE